MQESLSKPYQFLIRKGLLLKSTDSLTENSSGKLVLGSIRHHPRNGITTLNIKFIFAIAQVAEFVTSPGRATHFNILVLLGKIPHHSVCCTLQRTTISASSRHVANILEIHSHHHVIA